MQKAQDAQQCYSLEELLGEFRILKSIFFQDLLIRRHMLKGEKVLQLQKERKFNKSDIREE